jgi:hypothetical protein
MNQLEAYQRRQRREDLHKEVLNMHKVYFMRAVFIGLIISTATITMVLLPIILYINR